VRSYVFGGLKLRCFAFAIFLVYTTVYFLTKSVLNIYLVISLTEPLQVVFVGIRGTTVFSDIAIDYIIIRPQSCDYSPPCTFIRCCFALSRFFIAYLCLIRQQEHFGNADLRQC